MFYKTLRGLSVEELPGQSAVIHSLRSDGYFCAAIIDFCKPKRTWGLIEVLVNDAANDERHA
jgi:hypothetical protein